MSDLSKKIVGAAQVVLGLSLAYNGARALGLGATPAQMQGLEGGNAEEGWPDGQGGQRLLPAAEVIEEAQTIQVSEENIAERIQFIREQIRKDSLEPAAREVAAKILGAKRVGKGGKVEWAVGPQDYAGEVKRIFEELRDPRNEFALRYTHDHAEVDQFSSTRVNLALRIADCDDLSTVYGAVLRAVGYPIRLRVIQDDGSDSWSHIYLKVGLPPTAPTRWMALDPSPIDRQPMPAGWELEGAEQCARTGRPAGRVVKVKDFDV